MAKIKLYVKAVSRNYAENISALLLFAALFLCNLLCCALIGDAVELVGTLRSGGYSFVGLYPESRGKDNTYEYFGGSVFVYAAQEEDSAMDVVVLKETAESSYDGAVSPFLNGGNIVSGEAGELGAGEVALSQRAAEQYSVAAGDSVYLNSFGEWNAYTVRYIYRELYTIYDINVYVPTYSVLFSRDAELNGKRECCLSFCVSDDSLFSRIYSKDDEIRNLGVSYIVTACVCVLAVAGVASVFYNILNRKLYKRVWKMRHSGFSRLQVLAVESYRLGIALVPAAACAAAVYCLCGAGAAAFWLLAAEAAVLFLAEMLWLFFRR